MFRSWVQCLLAEEAFKKEDLTSGFKYAAVSSGTGVFYGMLDCTEQTNSSKLLPPLFSFPTQILPLVPLLLPPTQLT